MTAAGPARRYFLLCGFTIEVRMEDAKVDEVITELLAAFPVTPLSEKPLCAELRLSVAWAATVPSLPSPPASRLKCFGVTLFEYGHSCYICDGRSLFEFDRLAGIGRISLHPTFANQGLLQQHNFFLLGLMQGLLKQGFFDLHAAGVVNEDVGYLLVGEPASGKSTAALSLTCQGWGYLSDDALLLRRCTRGIEAFGFRRKFYVDPVLWRQWPVIAEHLEDSVSRGQSKLFIDLEKIYPQQFHESIKPGVLVFLRIVDEAQSRLLPLDQTSALVRLLAQSASLAFNRYTATEHLAVLRGLVNQTMSFGLCAGRDLYHEPARIAPLLARIETPSAIDSLTTCEAERQTATQRRFKHDPHYYRAD